MSIHLSFFVTGLSLLKEKANQQMNIILSFLKQKLEPLVPLTPNTQRTELQDQLAKTDSTIDIKGYKTIQVQCS